MRNLLIVVPLALPFLSCDLERKTDQERFLVTDVPEDIPTTFKQDLVPADKIIHKGIFAPDFNEYYYTLSDKKMEQFDVFVIQKENGVWSKPTEAFFNSGYNEHGMSFSPDGQSLYFSSTRPVPLDSILSTWHIWKCARLDGKWTEPEFLDIPGCRNKLVSHPSVTNAGNLYFHSSNPDYSEMDIYVSKLENGRRGKAKKLGITLEGNAGKCTPYVSPQGDFLIFAAINKQLDLMVTCKEGKNGWAEPRKLGPTINSNGQGNPFVTPDHKFLFFTAVDADQRWSVKWVKGGFFPDSSRFPEL